MFAIRAERDYVIEEDFMKAVRKMGDQKKLEGTLEYKSVWGKDKLYWGFSQDFDVARTYFDFVKGKMISKTNDSMQFLKYFCDCHPSDLI